MRREITELVWQKPGYDIKEGLNLQEKRALSKDDWMEKILHSLQLFNENLYRAYKDQYVR